MLIRLLRTYLRPYRLLLLGVLVCQGVQSLANLYLPTLNARIIDRGVLRHDTHYIDMLGGTMMLVTLVQVCFAVTATYSPSPPAMRFGRHVPHHLFHPAP